MTLTIVSKELMSLIDGILDRTRKITDRQKGKILVLVSEQLLFPSLPERNTKREGLIKIM